MYFNVNGSACRAYMTVFVNSTIRNIFGCVLLFLEDAILFLQCLLFFNLCVHFNFFSQVHFECELCI